MQACMQLKWQFMAVINCAGWAFASSSSYSRRTCFITPFIAVTWSNSMYLHDWLFVATSEIV